MGSFRHCHPRMSETQRRPDTESFAARKEAVLQRIAITEANTEAQLEKMREVQEEYDRLLDSKREMKAMAVKFEEETARNEKALNQVQRQLRNLNREEARITQPPMTKSKKKREKKNRKKLEKQ